MLLEFNVSYQDKTEYAVIGHPKALTVTVYSANDHMIEYMRSTFNHNGDPTSFQRNVLSSLGGAAVKISGAKWGDSRWTPDLYAEFIEYMHASYAKRKQQWEEMCKRRGLESEPFVEMEPLPKPIYWDEEAKHYADEPWFTCITERDRRGYAHLEATAA